MKDFYEVFQTKIKTEYEEGTLGAAAFHEASLDCISRFMESGHEQAALRAIASLDETYLNSESFLKLCAKDKNIAATLSKAASWFEQAKDFLVEEEEEDRVVTQPNDRKMYS